MVHGFSDVDSAGGPARNKVVLWMSFDASSTRVEVLREMYDGAVHGAYIGKLPALGKGEAGAKEV